MRTSIMAAVIILCFTLTLFSILTINSFSSAKLSAQTNLNASVDSAMHALTLDNAYNSNTYENVVGDLLQQIILQSDSNGPIDVKILNANISEGLLDVEIVKTFTWMGLKRQVTCRRTVILEEYDNPPETPVTVYFKYFVMQEEEEVEITWREETTFIGALLRRPKQPKKPDYEFQGWSYQKDGEIIDDLTWQDYIIKEDNTTLLTAEDGTEYRTLTFYAVFKEKTK